MCSQIEIYVVYISRAAFCILFLYLEFETLKLTRTQCEYIRVNARVCVSKQTCVSAHTAGYLKIDQSVQHHLHIHSWAFKHWSMYGTSHFQMQSWEWDTHYTTNWYKNTPLVNLYNSSSDIETGAFASESDLRIRLTSLLNFNLSKLTNPRNTEVSAIYKQPFICLIVDSFVLHGHHNCSSSNCYRNHFHQHQSVRSYQPIHGWWVVKLHIWHMLSASIAQ